MLKRIWIWTRADDRTYMTIDCRLYSPRELWSAVANITGLSKLDFFRCGVVWDICFINPSKSLQYYLKQASSKSAIYFPIDKIQMLKYTLIIAAFGAVGYYQARSGHDLMMAYIFLRLARMPVPVSIIGGCVFMMMRWAAIPGYL